MANLDANQFPSESSDGFPRVVRVVTPAASLLDHLDGWKRVYSDETAVLHIRTAN